MSGTPEQDAFDLIEAYLADELSLKEREAVETRLVTDPAFLKTYELHHAAHQLLEQGASLGLKSIMQASSQSTQTKTRQLNWRKWISIAAGILLLGLFSSWFWAYHRYADQQILAFHGQAYSAESLRADVQQLNSPFSLGMVAYSQANYSQAIEHFNQLTEGSSHFSTAQFYLGNAYIQNEQYASAVEAFQGVRRRQDLRFLKASEWYLTLAMLGTGEKRTFNELVEQILSDPSHPYRAKIILLQRDITSKWRIFPGLRN